MGRSRKSDERYLVPRRCSGGMRRLIFPSRGRPGFSSPSQTVWSTLVLGHRFHSVVPDDSPEKVVATDPEHSTPPVTGYVLQHRGTWHVHPASSRGLLCSRQKRPGSEQECDKVSVRGQSGLGRASGSMAHVCDFVYETKAGEGDACPVSQFCF